VSILLPVFFTGEITPCYNINFTHSGTAFVAYTMVVISVNDILIFFQLQKPEKATKTQTCIAFSSVPGSEKSENVRMRLGKNQ
jgi:hypothetical protein